MTRTTTFELTHGEVHLKLNSEQGWVTINDNDPRLTQGELQVLKVLAAHQGKPLRQDRIIADLYVHEVDRPKVKIVDVQICRIRKKFRSIIPAAEDLIENVWGKGYLLIAPDATGKQKAA